MNKGNYLSLSTVKGANLCLKFTKGRLAAGLRSDTEGREEKRERGRKGRGREVNVSRIKTD